MNFYNALQLDPAILKKKITQCQTKKERYFLYAAMAARSVLIVAFAIVFISALSSWFGSENTPFAVALFCLFLGIRFVNFEYCFKDSIVTLAIAFGILLLVPSIVAVSSPVIALFVHFIAFFALLVITTQRPELGNGGLYSFAYVYLTGNPVYGDALVQRALLALFGYLLCGTLLFFKHRKKHANIRFGQVLSAFHLNNPVNLWQLRMAIGVSIVLTAGQALDIKRFMWMGFACASLLSEYPYCGSTLRRFGQRMIGVFAGSGVFFLLYQLMPAGLHSLLGPLGGLCLGFCTDYRYKTAMNCLGALMLGVGIYGLPGAIALRITDTFLGVLFATIFAGLFHWLLGAKFFVRKPA